MKRKILIILLILLSLLTSCKSKCGKNKQVQNINIGNDDTSYGTSIDELNLYNGHFEEDIVDIQINCVSGTNNAYTINNNTITFSNISEDTVYEISGKLSGNIIIDIDDNYKFDLELKGLSIVSRNTNPIIILGGNEVAIVAKKDYNNYIYDQREQIDENDETLYSGAIYSLSDLEIGGKGNLILVSENNNGIHTKDDLQVKNLTMTVVCIDNALKGNDSVEIESGNLTLISTKGDAIKTSNSSISEKGNQKGTVSIIGGTHNIYAACDGIDAAYDVLIDNNTTINIYTDKYSNYSDVVTDVSLNNNYICFTSDLYYYSIKYYNSDDDYKWVNANYYSNVFTGRSTYYYYSFEKNTEYDKLQFYIYESEEDLAQDENYLVTSDLFTINANYDTILLTNRGGYLTYSWTNYSSTSQQGSFGGMGGMQEGNSDKGTYSTKGIKAANQITINNGQINIKSYDDAIHANKDIELENGNTPLGRININGGTINIYSNDDGIHADGNLNITNGLINITNSYEGIEGLYINITGGNISVYSKDDGINSTTTAGSAIKINDGNLYIYCSGDGIDANSRSSYSGIEFAGGNVVIITTSGGNSAIDTEQGYKYTGGNVVAIMPKGGMSNEVTHCKDFSSIGKMTTMSLSANEYLIAKINNTKATIQIPTNISAYIIVLGDSSPSLSTKNSVNIDLDNDGVNWN